MGKSLRTAYGEALVEAAKSNDKIVVLDADLAGATMTSIFKKEFPERHFDMGIAEDNMVCAAAGMARSGLIPFCSTFAIFGTGRAYEQIRNAICYTGLNVKFGFSHAGLSVGEDGGSHQSIEDFALMRVLPHMTIFAPCDETEMHKAVKAALEINGPVYIRTGRPNVDDLTNAATPFIPGKFNVMKEGSDVCIIANGLMIKEALAAADALAKEGIGCAVVNAHTIKPIDKEFIRDAAAKYKAIVTAEEHSVIGGLGSAVAEVLAGCGTAKFAMVGIEDKFGKSGKPAELFEAYGLTAENVAAKCKGLL